jgi:hypothetical protein
LVIVGVGVFVGVWVGVGVGVGEPKMYEPVQFESTSKQMVS